MSADEKAKEVAERNHRELVKRVKPSKRKKFKVLPKEKGG